MCIIEPGFFKTAVTSLDPIERELHRLWNQLDAEVKASYGDKYLDKCEYSKPGYYFEHYIIVNVLYKCNSCIYFKSLIL